MEEKPETNSISGCFFRIYWMILGNLALFICAAIIANKHAGTYFALSATDVVYWAFAISTGLARVADIRWFKGQNSMGAPATNRDLARYLTILIPVAAGLWVLAHVIAKIHS
jgi:hypothetical protein